MTNQFGNIRIQARSFLFHAIWRFNTQYRGSKEEVRDFTSSGSQNFREVYKEGKKLSIDFSRVLQLRDDLL